jgi:hypothetical protein
MTVSQHRARYQPAGVTIFYLGAWGLTVGLAILVTLLQAFAPIYQVIVDKEFFVIRTSWSCSIEYFTWDKDTGARRLRQTHETPYIPGEWKFSSKRFKGIISEIPVFGGGAPDCPKDELRKQAEESVQKAIAYAFKERGIRREGRVSDEVKIYERKPVIFISSSTYHEDRTSWMDYVIAVLWACLVLIVMAPIVYAVHWLWIKITGDPDRMIWVR